MTVRARCVRRVPPTVLGLYVRHLYKNREQAHVRRLSLIISAFLSLSFKKGVLTKIKRNIIYQLQNILFK